MADKQYRVGRSILTMPEDHKLDFYQSSWRLYDKALPEIVRAVAEKYPDMTAIDIGANIGDSAALICQYHDIPVLCVEGNPAFLEYLRQNLSRLPPCVEIVQALIGETTGSIHPDAMLTHDGTASVNLSTAAAAGAGDLHAITTRRLKDVLAEWPRFASSKFIKSDTDGSDFEIILSSRDVVASSHPVLFFEFDPTFRKEGIVEALRVISMLQDIGYDHFLVYDNFGNVMSLIEEKIFAQFEKLCLYILSHALTGRQIYYVDVCAFVSEDADIARTIYDRHFERLKVEIRNGWDLP